MSRLARPRWNPVDVEIQRNRDRLARWLAEATHARFFARLPKGDSERIRLPVRVPAELEPAAELPVVRQEDALVIRRDHPGRTGDVALEAGALEAVRMNPGELPKVIDHHQLFWKLLEVSIQEREQPLVSHGRTLARSRGLGYRSGMTYRAVIFDLGGVVVGSPLHAIRDYEKDKGIPVGFVNRVVVDTGPGGAWSRLERGELELEDFYPAFDSDCAEAGSAFSAREMMERIAMVAGPRPQMIAAIERIRDRGLKTAALTNNWKSDEAKADLLSPYFDTYVESAVEGVRKPDPKIYRIACERLGVEPGNAAFLDDIGRNLKTARGLGMATIKVDDPDQAIGELQSLLGFPLR